MVPTLTCGLFRVNTSLAIVPPLQNVALRTRMLGEIKKRGPVPKKLLLGIEPRTSSLPRTRSTPELQQRTSAYALGSPPRRAGEGNRTLVIGLEDRCSTIELHPRGKKEGKRPPPAGPCAF